MRGLGSQVRLENELAEEPVDDREAEKDQPDSEACKGTRRRIAMEDSPGSVPGSDDEAISDFADTGRMTDDAQDRGLLRPRTEAPCQGHDPIADGHRDAPDEEPRHSRSSAGATGSRAVMR